MQLVVVVVVVVVVFFPYNQSWTSLSSIVLNQITVGPTFEVTLDPIFLRCSVAGPFAAACTSDCITWTLTVLCIRIFSFSAES